MSTTWFPSREGLRWNTTGRHDEGAFPRHPVCTTMDIATALGAVLVWRYATWSDETLTAGQHWYFVAFVTLYLCSTAYHALPRKYFPLARYFDQVAIGWYICAYGLVFVCEIPWARWLIIVCMIGFAVMKWYDYTGQLRQWCGVKWEKRVVSLGFLAAGILSLGLCLLLNPSGVEESKRFWLAIVLFLVKLYYWHKSKMTPNARWGWAEKCHAILLAPTILSTWVVLDFG